MYQLIRDAPITAKFNLLKSFARKVKLDLVNKINFS